MKSARCQLWACSHAEFQGYHWKTHSLWQCYNSKGTTPRGACLTPSPRQGSIRNSSLLFCPTDIRKGGSGHHLVRTGARPDWFHSSHRATCWKWVFSLSWCTRLVQKRGSRKGGRPRKREVGACDHQLINSSIPSNKNRASVPDCPWVFLSFYPLFTGRLTEPGRASWRRFVWWWHNEGKRTCPGDRPASASP